MLDFSVAWLIQHKVLLPGQSTLSRLISEIRKRAAGKLRCRLSSLPNGKQRANLETLLQIPEGQRSSEFDRFLKGPTTISGASLIFALQRYLDLRRFGIHELDFSKIPPVRRTNLARYAGITSMNKIARIPEDRHTALLAGFVKAFLTSIVILMDSNP